MFYSIIRANQIDIGFTVVFISFPMMSFALLERSDTKIYIHILKVT